MLVGKDFAEADAGSSELVVGAVTDSGATLEEGAVFPWKTGPGGGGGSTGIGEQDWLLNGNCTACIGGSGLGKSRDGGGKNQSRDKKSWGA